MKNKSKIIGISLLIIIIFVFLFGEKIIKAEEINNGIDDGSLKDEIGSEYIEGIELSSKQEANTNYANLEWKLKENKGDWTYRVYQKIKGETSFTTISSKYDKQVKVLNIFPTSVYESGSDGIGADPMNPKITFTSQIDGKQYTLPKSAILKKWMEEANSEEEKGYGQGLISVDAVSLTEYNNNPNKYLKNENGSYKYDVLMFGSWNGNGGEDLNNKSVAATQSFIDTGRGVLFGHDTINVGHEFFSKLKDNVKMKVGNQTDIPWVGGETVRVVKKGYITKYPYNIEERNLSIPFSHTTGEYAEGDIWIKFVPPFNNISPGPDYGNNNYFITTWNNCAVTRTGDSNGEATADEQKILANVLFYLGQVTTENSAMAYTAEDLAAPDAPEVSVQGVVGSNYRIEITGRDNGTTYEHYVMGTNNSTGEKIYSNKTTITVTSGIKGYSWSIDDSATTIPDDTIEALPTINLNRAGQYLHIKAIDNAGNIGETKHIVLPRIYNGRINLTSSHREGTNYADLRWNAPNGNPGWTYRVYQKGAGESQFNTVSTNYNKRVKVLNIYPTAGGATNTNITFTSQIDGRTYTIPKSASLKRWMEEANGEEAKGYGKGLISVDVVSLPAYNSNPDAYLKNPDGTYKYDVLMFGSWDCNGVSGNGGDLNSNSVIATRNFINTGRGALFGHDTISECIYHPYFNQLANKANMVVNKDIPWVGCQTVRVVRKGYITKYPYNIEERNLFIPYSHTTGEYAYGNIWIKYIAPYFGHAPGPDEGYNNYFITTWNNCAVTRTGHSNCAATADEQKILANVLFYLGQVTTDTNAMAFTAEDLAAPDAPVVDISRTKDNNYKISSVTAKDNGTTYEHYVIGINDHTYEQASSNTTTTTVTSGTKGYSWVVDINSGTEPDGVIDRTDIIINKSSINQYLHIRAIDNAGNIGPTEHILLPAYSIPANEEDKDGEDEDNKNLFCIEENVYVPSKEDSTVLGFYAPYYKAGKAVGVTGVIYDAYANTNYYTVQQAFSKRVQQLQQQAWNRNYVSPTKPIYYVTESSKRAQNDLAYILALYANREISKDEAQKAIYGTDIAQNTSQTDLSKEAKEYEKYRQYIDQNGYKYKDQTGIVQTYYQLEQKYYIIGPFKVDYSRFATKQGVRAKADFSGIIQAIMYDENTNPINDAKWEFYYPNGRNIPSYDNNYKYPYPNEEFYIKIDYKTADISKISKIEFVLHEQIREAIYNKQSGTYNLIQWQNKYKNINGGRQYWLEEVGIAAQQIKAQDMIDLRGANTRDNKYLLEIKNIKTENNTEPGNNPDPGDNPDPGNNPDPGDNPNPGDKDDPKPEGHDPKDPDPTYTDKEDGVKLKMKFSGNVWNDGYELNSNGIRENGEKGINEVKVEIRNYKTKQIEQSTYTYRDSQNGDGYFEMREVPPGLYDIEFTYDGQKYTTTKFLVNGTVEDYYEYFKAGRYANNSKAEETTNERQNYNNKFYEIGSRERVYSTAGRIGSLIYNTEQNKSIIQTLTGHERENVTDYRQFAITSRTTTNNILYPVSKNYEIAGIEYIKPKDMYHINIGLSERKQVDGSLKMDVYESQYVIKGISDKYIHSQKNIRDDKDSTPAHKLEVNRAIDKYEQQINRADYNWDWKIYEEVYGDNFMNIWLTEEELAQINSKEELEAIVEERTALKGYIDTITIIRNDQADTRLQLAELANYYSKDLIYKANGYNDYEMSSWAVIKPDKTVEEAGQEYKKIPITWTESSKYGDDNKYAGKYNKIYTSSLDKAEYAISNQEYIELHLVYEIDKENNKLKTEEGKSQEEGKKAFMEINGYKGLNLKREIEGLIDRDSRPGNMIPDIVESYEDDEDKTPTYRLLLTKDFPGSNGDTVKPDENGNIPGIAIIDKDGNIIYPNGEYIGNAIEGSTWEDLRKDTETVKAQTLQLKNKQIVSDGYKQEDEPLINDVKIDLLQIFKSELTGKSVELLSLNKKGEPVTMRTQKAISLKESKLKEGQYGFYFLETGKYRVKTTYGDQEQLEKSMEKNGNIKYNGQDFQSVSTKSKYEEEGTEGQYGDVEIMINMDTSGSMGEQHQLERTKTIAIELMKEIQAKMKNAKIGISQFNRTAQIIEQISNEKDKTETIRKLEAGEETHLGTGLNIGATGYSQEAKKKVMIILTDSYPVGESKEDSIKALENIADRMGIYPITIVTSKEDEIFGTPEKPRKGQVYQIGDEEAIENITEAIKKYIADEIINSAMPEENTGVIKDLAGTIDDEGTRRGNIEKDSFNIMSYRNANRLNVEEIEKTEGEEKNERIEEFAGLTYMIAQGGEITLKTGSIPKKNIVQNNLGLEERPKVELTMEEEVAGIQVMLSDGNVIIDTEKGVSKNVMGLDMVNKYLEEKAKEEAETGNRVEKEKPPISVYLDEELMQGATVKVKYKIKIKNTGEIDKIGNYFQYEEETEEYKRAQETITTSAATVFSYKNPNWVFRVEDQTTEEGESKSIWELLDKVEETVAFKPSDAVLEATYQTEKSQPTVLRTFELNTPLYPEGSVEAEEGKATEVTGYLVLSKIINPEDEEDTLTYDNGTEIVQRINEMGRRSYTSIPGNFIPFGKNREAKELDEIISVKVKITKPLGGVYNTQNRAIYIIVLTMIAGIIIFIKKAPYIYKKKIYK